MKYYCTKCGSTNLAKKVKSNYGCALIALDLLFLVMAIFTFGFSIIGCIIIACCVKKKTVCRVCGSEDCLIPMNSPKAIAATKGTTLSR